MSRLPLLQQILSLQCVRRLKGLLKAKKIPEPEGSVQVIVEQTLKQLKEKSEAGRFRLPCLAVVKVVRLIRMRSYHCPIQYLLRQWYFRDLRIEIEPPLLIPRFETEHLVSLIIQKIRNRWPKGSRLKIVDFCCGTGVIGLSLLKQLEKDYLIHCTFIDIKPKALKFTKINADLNQISLSQSALIVGDMLQYLHLIDDSQVVVANPPYLGQKQYNKLQKQVKMYEDPAALLSGEDGLDLIRPLASHLASQLQKGKNLVAGIEYDGQGVTALNLQSRVALDQYQKRRYLIFE